jgi:hypothetical protein
VPGVFEFSEDPRAHERMRVHRFTVLPQIVLKSSEIGLLESGSKVEFSYAAAHRLLSFPAWKPGPEMDHEGQPDLPFNVSQQFQIDGRDLR